MSSGVGPLEGTQRPLSDPLTGAVSVSRSEPLASIRKPTRPRSVDLLGQLDLAGLSLGPSINSLARRSWSTGALDASTLGRLRASSGPASDPAASAKE